MIVITGIMKSKILKTVLENAHSDTELVPLPDDGRHYVSQIKHDNSDFIYLFTVPIEGKQYFLYSKKIGA